MIRLSLIVILFVCFASVFSEEKHQDAETQGECDPLYVELVDVEYGNFIYLTGLYTSSTNDTCNGEPIYMRVGYNSSPRYLRYMGNDTWAVGDVSCGGSSLIAGSNCQSSSGTSEPTKCTTWQEYYNDAWQDSSLKCACTQPPCNALVVQGADCQFLRDGIFTLAPENMWCGGRPIYRNDDCEFMSYVADIVGWIVGGNTCYNLGGIDVLNTQEVYPYNVPYVWREFCNEGWEANYNLRVSCSSPPGDGESKVIRPPVVADRVLTPQRWGASGRPVPPPGDTRTEL